jgi:hypothetical protein
METHTVSRSEAQTHIVAYFRPFPEATWEERVVGLRPAIASLLTPTA